MIEIKDLLAKFDNLLVSEEVKLQSILNILERVIGIKIKKEDIKIKNSTVYLNIKPIYKNEIFLQREKIFSLLSDSLGKKSPRDIR